MKRAVGRLGRGAAMAAIAYGVVLAGNLVHDAALAAPEAAASPVAVTKISPGLRGSYE